MSADELQGLSENRFWQIISQSLDGTDSIDLTMERQTKLLEQELHQLSYDEFADFASHFHKNYGDACRNDLWVVAYVVMGGCSDGCFMDFRTSLVTRGQVVYYAALRDPDSLCSEFEKIPKGEIPLWEYYFSNQFDARFGAEAYSKVYELRSFDKFGPNRLRDPENQWSGDDDASMKKICPKVFEKWWKNRRF